MPCKIIQFELCPACGYRTHDIPGQDYKGAFILCNKCYKEKKRLFPPKTSAKERLEKLTRYVEANPNYRFFQSIANCFGLKYLGKASDCNGKDFRDLWND